MKKSLRYIFTVLTAASLFWSCGKDENPQTPDNPDNPGKEEPIDPTPDKPEVKVWKIGDFYSKGFVSGVVVSVDEQGEHGMVVSLKENEAAWAYRYEEAMGSLPGSGAYNTSCVLSLKDWREYYPAFNKATEDNVGVLKNWFLPSMNELAVLYKAYTGHEANDTEGGTGSLDSVKTKAGEGNEAAQKALINKSLTDNGGTALSDVVYWSSNEAGPSIAYAFDMATGKTVDIPSELDKKHIYKVRAMASF